MTCALKGLQIGQVLHLQFDQDGCLDNSEDDDDDNDGIMDTSDLCRKVMNFSATVQNDHDTMVVLTQMKKIQTMITMEFWTSRTCAQKVNQTGFQL